MSIGTVIIGAGQAGAQLALSLRDEGYPHPVTLIGEEPHLPYHRPPLSKDFMSGETTGDELSMRTQEFFHDQGIRLITGTTVTSLDRMEQSVLLTGGEKVSFDNLVLATGARNRQLSFPGHRPGKVHYLRTREDAAGLKNALEQSQRILIIGAGFIGLEFASVAVSQGAAVTVVERGPRIMARAVSGEMSSYFLRQHQNSGVRVLCETSCEEFLRNAEGDVVAVKVAGELIDVDLVLIGIGVMANSELAERAGLEVDNGIIVDSELRTSDPAIFALGDCARYPHLDTGELVRVESVQNASDQAQFLAKKLCGLEGIYNDMPWFWSHQAGIKLQIAGLARPDDGSIILGDPTTHRYSICRLRNDILVAVESVNNAGDHLASRRILASGSAITKAELTSEGFSLKQAAKQVLQVPASV